MPGYIDYATDLFDAATGEQIARHFLALLESIVADPDCAIGELPMMSRAKGNACWSSGMRRRSTTPATAECTSSSRRPPPSIPKEIAIACGEATITYGELDARANGIARHLASLGVGKDVPWVSGCGARSTWSPRFSASSRREARTCRSIRAIPRSGCGSSSRTPALPFS
jgi:non-ribosomal peptide synthetase component F